MKKKNRLGIIALAVMTIVLSLQSVTAQAATCPFDRPEGFTEIWGTVRFTYTVGEAFRAKEVGLNIYPKNGGPQYYGDHLEFWANGTPIKDGYKFQEVGQKVITVKRYEKQAQYELQVVPVLNGTLKECTILTSPAKTTYRQSTEGFDPKDIVVKCVFTNGTTQNLGYKDLEFYAGTRGMDNYKWGTAVKDGYRFKEAGEKDLIIRVLNKEMRIPFIVLPFSDKAALKMEMTKEPGNRTYEVGEAFRADEFTLRCFYADGTTEDFGGGRLNITANGTQIYDGYKFKEAGKKDVVIRLGEFSTNRTLTVEK